MERKINEAVWWSAQCLTIHAFNFQIKHVHSWAGKLLLLSEAQAQSLPSSIRNWTQIGWTWWHSSACLCRKNHTKSRLSVLPKSCSALWSNYFSSGGTCTSQHPPPAAPRKTTNLHCAMPCHAMYVSSNCHYSHHGHYSHGPCSHHTRGAAILTIPASHSQKSVAVCPMLLATSLSPR